MSKMQTAGYEIAFLDGVEAERERIIKNIRERVADLRACSKTDNCQELATLIESYIPEWTEVQKKSRAELLTEMVQLTAWAYEKGEQK